VAGEQPGTAARDHHAQVVPREQLAEALATIAAVVPDTDGDDDAEWRAELVARYGTVRGFIRLLVEVIDFGAVEAGAPVVKALKGLPDLIGRKKVGAEEVATELVTGSWRRLVFAGPGLPHGLVRQGGVLVLRPGASAPLAAPTGRVCQGRRPLGRPPGEAAGRGEVDGR